MNNESRTNGQMEDIRNEFVLYWSNEFNILYWRCNKGSRYKNN